MNRRHLEHWSITGLRHAKLHIPGPSLNRTGELLWLKRNKIKSETVITGTVTYTNWDQMMISLAASVKTLMTWLYV
jgi:hypothetical protein